MKAYEAPNGVLKAWGAWFNPESGSLFLEPVRALWMPTWDFYVGQVDEEPTASKLGFGDHTFLDTNIDRVTLVIETVNVYHEHLQRMFAPRDLRRI